MWNFLKKCGITRPAEKRQKEQNWKATGVIALRDSNLKELPESVGDVGTAARVLDATNNRLTTAPALLGSLPNLQRLVLASNEISSLHSVVFTLQSLRVLALDNNLLTTLPEAVGNLQKLEKLSASNNKLSHLPSSLGLLKSLKSLIVNNNRLEHLVADLGYCSSLELLEAKSNCLTDLPESLSQLQKLKNLNLDNNRITAVPPAILLACATLQTLTLHDNPITPATFEATEGYAAFDARRKNKYNKAIASGALLDSSGLDEGVDRQVARS
jgi:Leucine-rich repeat (LRR) protein